MSETPLKVKSEYKESAEGLRDVKGTKVYLPNEQTVREKIADVLRSQFRLYGYRPVETSILEYWNVAASKYAGGSEILKETYKLKDQGGRELALRYELTFKLGKIIAMNPQMRLPFRRYEIGKVFRDGPMKLGRLREFTQCDVDVVGIKDLSADAELIALTFQVFSALGINDIYVQLNNRKLLFGIFEDAGVPESQFVECALSLDKLEKIGEESVRNELYQKDISNESIDKVFEILNGVAKKATNWERLEFLESVLKTENSRVGITELRQILNYSKIMGVTGDIRFIPNLARGLGYYTGPMWEVFAKSSNITSSLCGGGRWDDMIPKFLGTDKEYPATGMTFGLDVIYVVLQERKFKGFLEMKDKIPLLMVVSMDTLEQSMALAAVLRRNGISCEIAAGRKLAKTLEYADKEGIPFVAIVGKKEIERGSVKLKDMISGKEILVSIDDVSNSLKELSKLTT